MLDLEIKKKNNADILHMVCRTLDHPAQIPLLKFRILENLEGVEHAFSTRLGGVSEGMFSTMNFSYSRGDKTEAVDENYRRLAEALECRVEDIVFSDQTHTTNVLQIGRKQRMEKETGLPYCPLEQTRGVGRTGQYTDVDGLITDEPGIVLATFFADCVPLYFVDPVHHAIGLAHSGWRGTVGRMGQQMLSAMQQAFGTLPQDVFAAVGPSICQDCYEISEDVAEPFIREFEDHRKDILVEKSGGKYQLDLWKCNEIVLTEAGILPEHLAVTNLCTCCNPSLLFSHRASRGKRGNLAAFLFLRGGKVDDSGK